MDFFNSNTIKVNIEAILIFLKSGNYDNITLVCEGHMREVSNDRLS